MKSENETSNALFFFFLRTYFCKNLFYKNVEAEINKKVKRSKERSLFS